MNKINAWLEAFRLRTLPLAFSSILMGAFLAAYQGEFNITVFILSLVTTLFLQVLSNLANDYGDAAHGADAAEGRVGPRRMVSSGEISVAGMRKAIIVFAVLSLVSGIALLITAFGMARWMELTAFLALGLLCIWAAIKYTAGKNPYGYDGLGDIAVFLFFGIVGTVGVYYLFTKDIDKMVLLPAASCGFFATAVLNVNNMRDVYSDAKAGKKSIPVRIGLEGAKIYHMFLLDAGIISSLIFAYVAGFSTIQYIFLLAYIPFALMGLKIYKTEEPASLDPYLKRTALATLLFVLLFGAGLNYEFILSYFY